MTYDLRVSHILNVIFNFEQVQGHLKKVHYLFAVYTFLMGEQWTFLLLIKIAYDLRVSHEIDFNKCIIPV